MSDEQKAVRDGDVKARSFKDLLVWQKGMALAKGVYGITQPFPDHEKFGLVSHQDAEQERHMSKVARTSCLSLFTRHSSLFTAFKRSQYGQWSIYRS
jgi:hypothetical protein